MTQTSVIVVVALTTPFWLFQVSVVIFLLYYRYRKHESYCTTFFLLFTMLCILDSCSEIVCFIGQRIIAFPIVHPFYLSSPLFGSILYLYSALSLYVQCFIHLFIAVNRIWGVFNILRTLPEVFGKFGKLAIVALPFLPLPLLAPRFNHQAIFYQTADGEIALKYVDAWVKKYSSTTSTCVIFFTAFPTFILEIVTILKYRQLLRNRVATNISAKKFNQEYRLVCQAMVVLVMKVIVCLCQALLLIATNIGNTLLFTTAITVYVYSSDVLNLIGPVALVVVSHHVRKDYFNFWRSVYHLKPSLFYVPNSVVVVTKVSVIRTN